MKSMKLFSTLDFLPHCKLYMPCILPVHKETLSLVLECFSATQLPHVSLKQRDSIGCIQCYRIYILRYLLIVTAVKNAIHMKINSIHSDTVLYLRPVSRPIF